MNSHLVKRVKQAIEDVDLRINRKTKNPILNGKTVKAVYDPEGPSGPTTTLYLRQHTSFDDLCVSVIHESLHHASDLPEYLIDEALDRLAFTSRSLRWAAARKIGDHLLFRKPRK